MKQRYPHFLSLKSLLLSMFLVGAFYASDGQVYTTRLSGPNEQPPNNSPGTGNATVTIVGINMRVQATFSGLVPLTSGGLPSGTTAAHIHAPTAVPGAGLAGVATTTPTFAGFPLGVTAGTYDRTLDMTLASSYNPAYITANGGTPASAFAALKAAMDNGRSYFNVHTNAFPGGEIRGFLIVCPTINVSIPNAFALPSGVLPNTVYIGYAPASSLTLTSVVTGGTGPYNYTWSNGSNANAITVSPTIQTTYTLNVTDQNGCPGMASKTVNVIDVRGGKKNDKVNICHKPDKQANDLTIGAEGVAGHLSHGDMLGSCSLIPATTAIQNKAIKENDSELAFRVNLIQNPSANYFTLRLEGNSNEMVWLQVVDMQGRLVERRDKLHSNETIKIGSTYRPGIYLVEIVQGQLRKQLKLFKSR